MKSTTQRRIAARLGTVLAAATLLVGATACSSDDDTPSEPAENEVEEEVDEAENEAEEEVDEAENEVEEELDEVENEVEEELDG